jgi:hypothetical protein
VAALTVRSLMVPDPVTPSPTNTLGFAAGVLSDRTALERWEGEGGSPRPPRPPGRRVPSADPPEREP